MSVSEARAAFAEVLDRVAAGEEVVLTRHGRHVAVVVHPDSLRTRRAGEALSGADRLGQLLDAARSTSLSEAPTIRRERADQLIDHVAAARAAR